MRAALRVKFPDDQRKNREFSSFRPAWGLVAAEKASSSLGFPSEFPNQPNRELFSRNRELFRRNREFAQQNRELLSNPKSPYNRPSLNKSEPRRADSFIGHQRSAPPRYPTRRAAKILYACTIGPRSNLPGNAPVCSFFRRTTWPLTTVANSPSDFCFSRRAPAGKS